MTKSELDELRKRALSGSRIFRSATVLRLLDMIDGVQMQPPVEPPPCPDCGRPMTRREPWTCANCGEDIDL